MSNLLSTRRLFVCACPLHKWWSYHARAVWCVAPCNHAISVSPRRASDFYRWFMARGTMTIPLSCQYSQLSACHDDLAAKLIEWYRSLLHLTEILSLKYIPFGRYAWILFFPICVCVVSAELYWRSYRIYVTIYLHNPMNNLAIISCVSNHNYFVYTIVSTEIL